MTRLDAYNEAVRFMRQAVDAFDQAMSCLKDANCSRGDLHKAQKVLVKACGDVVYMNCDECYKDIAKCECSWLKEPVGRIAA
jgi:hypothetical protein